MKPGYFSEPEVSNSSSSPSRQEPTVLTGLIGRDIMESRSPWLHEQEGRAQGLALTYTLFDFAQSGRNEGDLAVQLSELQAAGFAGVNITHPYKQAIIAHLDGLSAGATRIGAVNTVQFLDGEMIGYNTDVIGFAESMKQGLPDAAFGTVVQFGAGGAGSATAHALMELGTERLCIVERNSDRRDALVSTLRSSFGPERVYTSADGAAAIAAADGVVNATPLGMSSHPGTPFDTGTLTADHWVADIVYFPLETQLLRDARARGCQTLDGSGMAVLQAAEAFDIFTGIKADRARMHKSFVEFVSASAAQAA
jgi:shikimate dehydrogenase